MHRFYIRLVVICLLAIFAIGCSSVGRPVPTVAYYSLEYAPPEIEKKDALPVVLRIERFRLDPVYDTERIVYREKPFTLDSFNYHLWRVNPGDLVSSFLARDFGHAHFFKAVIAGGVASPSSHTLQGSVDQFYQDEAGGVWEAVISVNVILVASKPSDIDRKVLFQKKYSDREICGQKNPRALAEAMSKAMARISRAMINDVYARLAAAAGQGS